jgi:hypothetical protein
MRFSGLGGFLGPVIGRSAEVAAELRRITRPEFLPPYRGEPFVPMHVRAGDFSAADEAKLRAGEFNMRLPLGWYVDVAARLRDVLPSVAIGVFSDGSPAELAPILAVPGKDLVTGGSAITDLLDMSAATYLVASGSTLSSWAAFLGQVPSIWFPGQFRSSLLDGGDRGVEATWEPGDPMPDRIVEAATARLS